MTIPAVSIDPFDEQFLADPSAHHPALRDAGAVLWLEAIGCYGLARYAEVQPALKDWSTFLSGRGVGLADFANETPWRPPSLLLEADPPLHDRTRGLMHRIASLASLKEKMPAWRAKAAALVDRLVAQRHFDAATELGEVFPLMVFPDLIGLRDGGQKHLIPYGTTAFNAFGPRNRLYEEALAGAAEAINWVADACKRENLVPGGWGMQVYDAADHGDCSLAEAERLVRSFLTAGVDTTVNGLGHMIHAFAEHPDQWLRLRKEPGLAKRVFEETLRWGGPVQTFFRTTSRDVEISGETVPEGAKVLLFLAAANRDPRKWPEPDRFDIARIASGHVGFGFGIHQCLGQMVARMEAEAVLDALLERVAEIRPTGPAVPRLNNTLRAFASIPVEVVPL